MDDSFCLMPRVIVDVLSRASFAPTGLYCFSSAAPAWVGLRGR